MAFVKVKCPSNIALVKYWGKKSDGVQLPQNASISFTLKDLYAETKLEIVHGNISGEPAFQCFTDGIRNPKFELKISSFFKKVYNDYSVIQHNTLAIYTKNNFPHGTGIASSAAGFGALALAIVALENRTVKNTFEINMQEVSSLARIGSGSACRSMFSQPAIWGMLNGVQSSDYHAIPWIENLDPVFDEFCDAVLIVDSGEKSVSSSAGHALLEGNPYAAARYATANENVLKIMESMRTGKIRQFIHIVESEALQLHALMMSSNPYYILLRPNTLAIIEKIWTYRQTSGLPLMFTLDAGANVHLLYPKKIENDVLNFIRDELLVYTDNGQYLCSAIGGSAEILEINV